MKKICCFICVFMSFIFSIVWAKYSDVPENHWAYETIIVMSEKGIINGYPDGTFAPNNYITRAEVAKIFVKSLDLKEKSTTTFIDVDESFWAYDYIKIMSKYLTSYVNENNQQYYSPNEYTIREDVAEALVKALNLQNEEYDLHVLDMFSDKNLISEDIKKYVAIAVKNDLLRGNANGTFNPKGNLTRAEVSKLIMNAFEWQRKGSESNPIEIRNTSDLELIRNNPDLHYKLLNDLTLSDYSLGEGWKPIEKFSGTLDGGGHTISSLTINRPTTNNIGFFSELTSGSKISNLKIDLASISGKDYVGTLAGISAGEINNVEILNGSLVGTGSNTGGLVGSQKNGIISNCIVKIDSINSIDSIGGITGTMHGGVLEKSGAKISIVGNEKIGGAIGSILANDLIQIEEVMADTNIKGNKDLGGLIGSAQLLTDNKLSIKNSYCKGIVDGVESNFGGFIGYMSVISQGAYIEFSSLYTTLDILNKVDTAGGFIGYTNIPVTTSLSSSYVFWERDLAPGEILRDIGSKMENTFILQFDNKTSDAMRIRNTFAGWDFNIWEIDERINTPYLKNVKLH